MKNNHVNQENHIKITVQTKEIKIKRVEKDGKRMENGRQQVFKSKLETCF
jgi:hypothetical protein